MARFNYRDIEEQLIEALPELRPAAEHYWSVEGRPGNDCGPYIFVDEVFNCYLEVLLAVPAGGRRDELVARVFAVVDEAIGSGDAALTELMSEVYEGRPPSWFNAAAPFIGPRSGSFLDAYHSEWRQSDPNGPSVEVIVDLHGVRAVIEAELERAGERPALIPGTSHLRDRSA